MVNLANDMKNVIKWHHNIIIVMKDKLIEEEEKVNSNLKELYQQKKQSYSDNLP